MPGSRTAGASLAGYLWQVTEACRRAIQLGKDDVLSIERHDDLAVVHSGGALILEQLKHSQNPGTISEESPDWWSAIDAWTDPTTPDAEKRCLVTTDFIAGGSLLSECYRPVQIAPWDKLIEAMDTRATLAPNTKFANRGTYHRWLDLEPATKRRLIESIAIVDQAAGLKDSIRRIDEEILNQGVLADAVEATRDSFLGAIMAKVSNGLDGDGLELHARELRQAFMKSATRAMEEGYYDLPDVAIDAKDIEDLRTNKMQHMLPQLAAIGRDKPKILLRALETWYHARHHRDRLMKGTAHAIADLQAHDRALIAHCENQHAKHLDAPVAEHVSIGQGIYHTCMDFQTRLGKGQGTLPFHQGSYYELSNDIRVRWHPKYGEAED